MVVDIVYFGAHGVCESAWTFVRSMYHALEKNLGARYLDCASITAPLKCRDLEEQEVLLSLVLLFALRGRSTWTHAHP